MTRRTPSGFVSLALLATLAAPLCAGCAQVVWRGDLRGSLNRAAEDGRMVVVWYWRPMNRDCDQMARTVFRTEEVVKQMQGTIPVRLHADFSRKWAAEHGVSEVPTFLAYAPDGRILRRRDGVMDADQFLAFLAVARLSP